MTSPGNHDDFASDGAPMEGMDRDTALRVERLRLTWDFIAKEADDHRHRLLTVLGAALAGAVTTGASILFEKVARCEGGLALIVLLTVAAYAYVLIGRLARGRRRSLAAILDSIERLMERGGR